MPRSSAIATRVEESIRTLDRHLENDEDVYGRRFNLLPDERVSYLFFCVPKASTPAAAVMPVPEPRNWKCCKRGSCSIIKQVFYQDVRIVSTVRTHFPLMLSEVRCCYDATPSFGVILPYEWK